MMAKFKIEYFDEIEATDLEEAKEFLLRHLEKDVEYKDVTAFEIKEIEKE
tara:strand:- start:492 stop:641 length:150 start_codon:yes stop_codon:yes gene_type:complete